MGARAPQAFAGADQPAEEHWRGIVLFGRNVASYKFALAKSLFDLGRAGREFVTLEELALPFSEHICEHIRGVDRQGSFQHSRFLDACRYFNGGRINIAELEAATVTLGFKYVLDAFHFIGDEAAPTRFFADERARGGIRLTDDLLEVVTTETAVDLYDEAESRWRLVESAWEAKADGNQVTVLYDSPHELLITGLLGKRRPITDVRPALNGYQMGHCFYCFRPTHLLTSAVRQEVEAAHVDHFLPFVLNARGLPVDLDQPWNLVLACQTCNLGKSHSIPHDRYLSRLHQRNEFLIGSHHPLRDTLMFHTGGREPDRRQFLTAVMRTAQEHSVSSRWSTHSEGTPLF